MNVKKVLPVLMLVILAVITLAIKRCNNSSQPHFPTENQRRTTTDPSQKANNNNAGFDRNTNDLFFTKHAKCRMKCRHITQQEVKDILVNGTINYDKSDLNDPRGATYAVEGLTSDDQHVRIIFSPKKQHLTVVTVIDLDVDHVCNCT